MKTNNLDRSAVLAAQALLKEKLLELEQERFEESQTVAEGSEEEESKTEHYFHIDIMRSYYLRAIDILEEHL